MELIRKVWPSKPTGHIKRNKVEIRYDPEDGRLSITGEGFGCAGQIIDELYGSDVEPCKGWTPYTIGKLQAYWRRWHLNDMRAGTPRQEELIRQWKVSHRYDYKDACKYLESEGLLYDNGYKYGTGWLTEPVPEGVLAWLFSQPGTGATWSDVEAAMDIPDDVEVPRAEFDLLLGGA